MFNFYPYIIKSGEKREARYSTKCWQSLGSVEGKKLRTKARASHGILCLQRLNLLWLVGSTRKGIEYISPLGPMGTSIDGPPCSKGSRPKWTFHCKEDISQCPVCFM